MKLRNQITALFLLAPAAFTLTALPASALAQQATPEVLSLQVNSDNGVSPGSRLRFTLQGSPGARASVRIRGVREPIKLNETSPGVYRGRYVVGNDDRIEPGDPIRATLRRGNRAVTASYDIPANVAAGGPQLRIEHFQMAAVDRVEPGTELSFMLDGAPGATAFVAVPGIENNVAMREVRAGHYEGSYTVRRSDRLDLSAPFTATLRAGNQTVTAILAQPQVAANTRPPAIVNVQPREGESVSGDPVTVVSGRFEDRGGSGVDPGSVRIMLSGRNVTGDTQVSPDSFTFRGPMLPGRHTVDVTARDRAGNAVAKSWSFDVASAGPNLRIQVLNHPNNGQVDRNGTVIRARTAPYATVDIRVDAVPPGVGQVSVARQVLSRTLQADANGNFEFGFNSVPLPGTRYEVLMTARKADITAETRLVLFQGQS